MVWPGFGQKVKFPVGSFSSVGPDAGGFVFFIPAMIFDWAGGVFANSVGVSREVFSLSFR